MLLAHIINFDIDQGAIFQSFLDDIARLIGVDVDFDDRVIIHHNHTIPNGFEIGAQTDRIPCGVRILMDQKFRTISEFDLSIRVGNDFLPLAVMLGSDGEASPAVLSMMPLPLKTLRIPPESAQSLGHLHLLRQLFKDGKKLRCGGKRLCRAFTGGVENSNRIRASVRRALGAF